MSFVMRVAPRLLATILASAAMTAAADAQVTPPLIATVSERAATIDGACFPGATVQITIRTAAATTLRLDDVACGADGRFSANVAAVRLLATYQVVAVQVTGGATSPAMTVSVAAQAGPFVDEREDLESTAFLGLAIDTFGAQELNRYLNPEANGQIHERSIFGVDFAYRLLGRATSARQLWVYGETLHGARSEDIDCAAAPELPSCKKELADFATGLPQATLFLLRNATSLEAYLGVRLELGQLHLPGRNPAAVYITFQPGFLEVAGSDGDAKAAHHVGVGARAVGGRMQGSYLEVGFGRSELFLLNRNRRFKFDGMLQRDVGKGFSLFAQLFADVDMRDGSDSIQSYFGLNFDIGALFRVAD